MTMAIYQYRSPETTPTLEQFIASQSAEEPTYYNFSFQDVIGYEYLNERIIYPVYNVLSNYIDDIRSEYCVEVTLTDKEYLMYKYNPKYLCYKEYNCAELYFIILILNDMCSYKQFTKRKLYLPTKAGMKNLCQQIFNANKEAIKAYNRK